MTVAQLYDCRKDINVPRKTGSQKYHRLVTKYGTGGNAMHSAGRGVRSILYCILCKMLAILALHQPTSP